MQRIRLTVDRFLFVVSRRFFEDFLVEKASDRHWCDTTLLFACNPFGEVFLAYGSCTNCGGATKEQLFCSRHSEDCRLSANSSKCRDLFVYCKSLQDDTFRRNLQQGNILRRWQFKTHGGLTSDVKTCNLQPSWCSQCGEDSLLDGSILVLHSGISLPA